MLVHVIVHYIMIIRLVTRHCVVTPFISTVCPSDTVRFVVVPECYACRWARSCLAVVRDDSRMLPALAVKRVCLLCACCWLGVHWMWLLCVGCALHASYEFDVCDHVVCCSSRVSSEVYVICVYTYIHTSLSVYLSLSLYIYIYIKERERETCIMFS